VSTRLWWRYRIFYPLLVWLPAGIAYRLATAAGRRAAARDQTALAAADAALGEVFPALTPPQRRAKLLALGGLRARETLDVYRLRHLRPDNLGRLVTLKGLEHLQRAMAEGRPVILYSAHFGRLIMPAMALGIMGIQTSCLTADIDDARESAPRRRFLAFKLREMQRLMGGDMIQRSAPLRRLYRVLHDKGVLIVILDAPPAASDAVERFPFLGGSARLSVGTLRLARRTDALLLPYFAFEKGIAVEGRILPPIDLSGLDDATALARLFAPIEQSIRARPDHWWLWQILNVIRPPRAVGQAKGRHAPELA
jgi:KDO2-lipid IV(A) lauroyltransferase